MFLGMVMQWLHTQKGERFRTGMHFRDNDYPIRIRRYPADGSMVTDAQRIGVLKGQIIRAQRLCSVMQTFKTSVQQVVLAAMRRGYKRRELDRTWGRFLVEWWKAEEVRRGELRAWFRRMTAWVSDLVENESHQFPLLHKVKACRFGNKCVWREHFCPFSHPDHRPTPGWEWRSMTANGPEATGEEQGQAMALDGPLEEAEIPLQVVPASHDGVVPQIPKAAAVVWQAAPDGACFFHSILQNNTLEAVRALKEKVIAWIQLNQDVEALHDGRTVRQLVELLAPSVDVYIETMRRDAYEGDEQELALFASALKVRLHTYKDSGDAWSFQFAYGLEGPVQRLLYNGRHYDLLLPKEAWLREWEQEALESRHGGQLAMCAISVQEVENVPSPEPSTTEQRGRLGDGSDGRRDSAKVMTTRDKGAAKRRGSQHKEQQGRHSQQVAALREDDEQAHVHSPSTQELVEVLVSMAGGEAIVEPALPATVLLEEEHERLALGFLEEAQAQLLSCWLQSTAILWRPGVPAAHKPPDREPPKTVELTGAKARKENWQSQQGVRKSSQLTQLRRQSQLDAIMEGPSQQAPKVFCKCGSPENPREYWIQCTECRQWYHPRCIGMTKAQCEQERLSGGFVCPDCII